MCLQAIVYGHYYTLASSLATLSRLHRSLSFVACHCLLDMPTEAGVCTVKVKHKSVSDVDS